MKTKQAIISVFSLSAFGLIVYLITRVTKGEKVNQSASASSVSYIPNWNKPFNMEFADEVKAFLAPKRVSTLEASKATRLAKEVLSLKSAPRKKVEQSIRQIFLTLKSKVELSNLSTAFFKASGGKDFYRYLDGLLTNSSMQNLVINRVNQLANYNLL